MLPLDLVVMHLALIEVNQASYCPSRPLFLGLLNLPNVLAQKAGVERAAAGEQARLSAITRVKEAASAPARNR